MGLDYCPHDGSHLVTNTSGFECPTCKRYWDSRHNPPFGWDICGHVVLIDSFSGNRFSSIGPPESGDSQIQKVSIAMNFCPQCGHDLLPHYPTGKYIWSSSGINRV